MGDLIVFSECHRIPEFIASVFSFFFIHINSKETGQMLEMGRCTYLCSVVKNNFYPVFVNIGSIIIKVNVFFVYEIS